MRVATRLRLPAVLLAAALLAGCTSAGGRYAATVDGEPAVETAEVARLVREADAAGVFEGADADATLLDRRAYQQAVLSLLLNVQTLEELARQADLDVGEDAMAAALEERIAEVGGEDAYREALTANRVTDTIDRVLLRAGLLNEALAEVDPATSEELFAQFAEREVEVDPRLGVYDPASQQVVDGPPA